MNLERLESIYRNTHLADKSDMDSIKQLTIDYPYFALPYVVLSKYYHDTNHYKFEEMLRQAAMRVKDRKALYDYIHKSSGMSDESSKPIETAKPENISVNDFLEETIVEEDIIKETITDVHTEPEASIIESFEEEPAPSTELEVNQKEEISIVSVDDFLNDEVDLASVEEIDEKEAEISLSDKPDEFIIETHVETRPIDKIEIDYDIIGEELETEFAFSKSFVHKEEVKPSENEQVEITDINFVDNTASDKLEDSTEGQEEPIDKHLRKYPVYSIENYFKDEVGQKGSIEVDEQPSSEKDFFAWLKAPKTTIQEPEKVIKEEDIKEEVVEEKVVKSLDIIDRFITNNPQITRPKKEFFNPENMAKRSEIIDLEFVSETLANIYYEQGNYELALKAYEKLSLQNPSKQAYFASLIEKINKERK